jgi:hypothetical protein
MYKLRNKIAIVVGVLGLSSVAFASNTTCSAQAAFLKPGGIGCNEGEVSASALGTSNIAQTSPGGDCVGRAPGAAP